MISKTKPKIRIIHIFAPEIIKTDAANFRELVQRLTGKPDAAKTKERVVSARKKEETTLSSSKKMEFHHAEFRERVKEEEIWMSGNSGGGFLGSFGEIDGFMHELNHFQFLEGTSAQMEDVYGDQCQLA